MALPLLLGLGLGYMGGAQFLMKKRSDSEAQSLFDQTDFAAMPGLDGEEAAAQYEAQAQSLLGEESGFFDAGKYNKMHDLTAAYNSEFGARQTHQKEMEKLNWERSLNRTDAIEQDYNRDLKTFGSVVQPAYLQAVAALGPNMNSADAVAALYNFFNIMEPGGRVTENEDGSFSGIGGKGSQFANWMNAIRGGGLDEKTKSQILSAVNNQYGSQLDRARRQRAYYDKEVSRYNEQGYSVNSPVGSLGIDYDSPLASPTPRPPLTDAQQKAIQGSDWETFDE
jgi:hypothetical protein